MYHNLVRMLRRLVQTMHWTDAVVVVVFLGVIALAIWLEMGGF